MITLNQRKLVRRLECSMNRDILGLWVSGEGMVYRDFNKDTMKISRDDVPDELSIYCGVDWGYEHKGSIVCSW